MRLAEILFKRGWLSPASLRSVPGCQALEDEQLATGLLEEGLLTADQVAVALGLLFEVPPALDQDFARVDRDLLRHLRARQAERLKSIPLYALPNRRVAVAMVHPHDLKSMDELGFALGATIEPMATSEPVLARKLEMFYSMPRRWTTGYHPVASPAVTVCPTTAPMMAEDNRSIDLMPMAVNAGFQFEAPNRPPRSTGRGDSPDSPRRARVATQSYLAAVSDVPLFVPDDPGASVQAVGEELTPVPPMVSTTGSDETVERILSAEDRQAAADHLFTFMRSCFGAGAMLAIAGVFAEGRFGYNEGEARPAVESLVLSLFLPSCFHTAYREGTVFHGAPSPEGEAVHRALWAALGCQPPREIVVAPVVVAGHTVLLLYGHGRNGARVESFAVSRLGHVCAALAETLLRLA
jgi:hypothetical protein